MFVHEDVYDDVVPRIVSTFDALRLGLPTDPDTECGCLSSPAQLREGRAVRGAGAAARAPRWPPAVGGPTRRSWPSGCFYRPTVFVDVEPTMRIANEEVFGPVLCVLRWRDEAAMIEDVNRVELGLTANIWTR